MSHESAYQQVKRYINKQFDEHRRYIAQKDLAAAKEERDRALSFLGLLLPSPTPPPTQAPLVVEE